jgi:AcrR family transcriptional regulator
LCVVAANGRERQRNRTRRLLIHAAAEMVRNGQAPSIAELAEAADVARATAYRYFPTREQLLAEVSLFATGGPLELGERDAALPVPDAVARLVRQVAEWAFENETALRTLLRHSLDPATGIRRPGHRTEWIEDVLVPVREQLPAQTYARLATALTLLLGIDPIVALTDIAGASREQALDTLEWTARALVESARAEADRSAA